MSMEQNLVMIQHVFPITGVIEITFPTTLANSLADIVGQREITLTIDDKVSSIRLFGMERKEKILWNPDNTQPFHNL